ncbi:hypothetical protein [Pseudomonas juntendi]|uniref:hypothetical protein n=1 Tax=Pseudomonas juntendi TaxID=2666183 RepID=UPI00320B4722
MSDNNEYLSAVEILKKLLADRTSTSTAKTVSKKNSSATNTSGQPADGVAFGQNPDQPKDGRASESRVEMDAFLKDSLTALQAKSDDLARNAVFLKQAESTIRQMINQSQSQMQDVESRLAAVNSALNESGRLQAKLVEEVQTVKSSAVSALSIFVSFFAFITVSINVFSKAGNVFSGLALVMAFWSMLVGFNILIGWQLNTLRNNALAFWLLFAVAVLSIGSTIVMYAYAPDEIKSPKAVFEQAKSSTN